MILLVDNSTPRIPERAHHLVGDFKTPASRTWQGRTPVWAADNGCFGHFDRDRFLRMLDALAAAPIPPRFVTVPDVVADHGATVERWLEWAPEFASRKLPRAWVLQNGAQANPPEFAIPWSNMDALFIGGDTAFKLGPWVHRCVQFSKRCVRPDGSRIWCHMGRVNSIKRLHHAIRIGCDSCDGSGLARFPSQLRLLLNALLHFQLPLL